MERHAAQVAQPMCPVGGQRVQGARVERIQVRHSYKIKRGLSIGRQGCGGIGAKGEQTGTVSKI